MLARKLNKLLIDVTAEFCHDTKGVFHSVTYRYISIYSKMLLFYRTTLQSRDSNQRPEDPNQTDKNNDQHCPEPLTVLSQSSRTERHFQVYMV